jgi:hypothetical protein
MGVKHGVSVSGKKNIRLRILDYKVLMKIRGHKRENVTGGCSEVHNEELHNGHFHSTFLLRESYLISMIDLRE